MFAPKPTANNNIGSFNIGSFYNTWIQPTIKTVYDETSKKMKEVWAIIQKEYNAKEADRLIKKGHYVALGITIAVSILTVAAFGVTAVPIAALIFGVSLLFIIKSIRNEKPEDPKPKEVKK